MSIAVILVGGRGKRLGKLTLRTPKPLIKINNIRFLDILIKKISKFKIKKIYLLCSYKKEEFFNEYHQKKINKIKIICIDEGKQKDTGGALFKLKNKLNDHFYLFNGDTFLDFDFIKLSKFNKNDSILHFIFGNK